MAAKQLVRKNRYSWNITYCLYLYPLVDVKIYVYFVIKNILLVKTKGMLWRMLMNNFNIIWIKNVKWTEIALYGGTFTGLDRSIQKQILKAIAEKTSNLPVRISTRPDFIDIERLHILKSYNVKTIELGIQSMSEKVLKLNRRYCSENTILQSMEHIIDCEFILAHKLCVVIWRTIRWLYIYNW